MKPVVFFLLTFAIISFSSCRKERQSASKYVDLLVNIMVENSQGQNLLDPATPGYFKDGDIKKYDLVNSQSKLYYDAKLDWPNGYHIVTSKDMGNSNGKPFISVVPNTESKENPTTTYIDWGNSDKDTLVCKMTKDEGGYYYYTEEVWFNGAKVYPTDHTADFKFGSRSFKIVK